MDAGTSLTTTCTDAGPALVVTVDGEIDIVTAPRLRDALQQAMAGGQRKPVVVDLTAVRLLSSLGLAVLSETHEQADAIGMPLQLVSGSSRLVGRILQISGLNQVVPVHPDLAEALAALSCPSGEDT